MDLKKPKSVIIPPYLTPILLAIACFAFAYWRCSMTSEFHPRTIGAISACIIVGCYSTIIGLTHCSIHDAGIWVRFFYIPIRWISWDKVLNAMYIQKWTTGGKNTITINGHAIVVTLLGCELFDPEVDGLPTFLMKHPFRSFFIRFTSEKKDLYLEAFQKYCYLSFQSEPVE